MTLFALARREHTGEVLVLSEVGTFRISMRRGGIVGATCPRFGEVATRVAAAGGFLSAAWAPEATRRISQAPARDPIDVIADIERLTPDRALRLRRRVIAQAAARTFAIERGDFRVTAETGLDSLAGLPVDVRAVVYLAARTILDPARIATELAPYGPRFVLTADAEDALTRFGFTDAERPVLDALAAGVGLAELDAVIPGLDARIAHGTVYALVTCLACVAATAENARMGRGTPALAYAATASGSDSGLSRIPEPTMPPVSRTSTPTVAARGTSPSPPRTTSPSVQVPPRTTSPSMPVPPRTTSPSMPVPPRTTSPSVPVPPRTTSSSSPAPAAPPRTTTPMRSAAPSSPPARTTSPSSPITPRATSPSGSPVTPRATSTASPAQGRAPTRTTAPMRSASPSSPVPTVSRTATPTTGPTASRTAPTTAAPSGSRTTTPPSGPIRATTGPITPVPPGTVPGVGPGARPATTPPPADSHAAIFARAQIALDRDDLTVAIRDLKRAIELAPDAIEYQAVLAWANFRRADDKEAVAHDVRQVLMRAIVKSNNPDAARFLLGRVERMLGRDREALRHFQIVLEEQPRNAEAAAEIRFLEHRLSTTPRR